MQIVTKTFCVCVTYSICRMTLTITCILGLIYSVVSFNFFLRKITISLMLEINRNNSCLISPIGFFEAAIRHRPKVIDMPTWAWAPTLLQNIGYRPHRYYKDVCLSQSPLISWRLNYPNKGSDRRSRPRLSSPLKSANGHLPHVQ